MKFISGFPNLVSNRFRKNRGEAHLLYTVHFIHISMWVHLENLNKLGDLKVMYNARQERKGVTVSFHHIFGTFNMGCSEGLGAF